ncbi:MAG TPA: hypothetical protein VMU36_07385 [Spirochaetia bacterium]|nr:hypothetical protein [Spirochaetia bacterium]
MKPSTRDILFIFVGLFISIGTLWASKAGSELRLGRDVAYLNSLGRSPSGERSLSLSLESRFRTEPGQIADLRKRRLGYGDISAVLAIASRLQGGIDSRNIERVVSLWRGPRAGNWGRIARSLGVRVERVVLQIESLRAKPRVTSNTSERSNAGMSAARASAVGTPAARPRGYDPVLKLVHGG